MKYLLLFCLLVFIPNCSSAKTKGLSIKHSLNIGAAPKVLHLEVFYDLLCIYSKNNFFLMQSLLKNLNLTSSPHFNFTIYTYPLPKFKNSNLINTVLRLFQNKLGTVGALNYMAVIFNNQNQFWDKATRNLTESQIEEKIADTIISSGLFPEVNREEILSAASNRNFRSAASRDWKEGVKRNVYGTPFIFIDGNINSDANGFGYDEWAKLIMSYTQ